MTWLSALDTVTGSVLVVAGIVCWRGRPTSRAGAWSVLAGLCWFAGSVLAPLAFLHRGPLVLLHLSYPTGRVHRRPAAAVVALAWVVGLVEGLRPVPWLTLALSVLVAAAALDIFTRSSGNARKAGVPALAAALLFADVLAAGAANRLLDLRQDTIIATTYDVVVVAVVVWLTVDLLAGRWTDATVADLVAQLGAEPDAHGVQAALRRALGDPTLVVGFHDERTGGYVDEHGRPSSPQPEGDQEVTPVEQAGRPVAIIVHARADLDDADLMTAAAAAVRLAVGNLALRAEIEEQKAVLTSARRGLVEAADAQRVALSNRLGESTERSLARLDALLEEAGAGDLRGELAGARADLHDLAQGVRPRELSERGLAGVLPELAGRCPVPVELTVRISRLAPAVESALYFVCAEALTNLGRHASASSAIVTATVEDGCAVVLVQDDGNGGADPAGSGLRGLADRVQALDGELEVFGVRGRGTYIRARIPTAEAEVT